MPLVSTPHLLQRVSSYKFLCSFPTHWGFFVVVVIIVLPWKLSNKLSNQVTCIPKYGKIFKRSLMKSLSPPVILVLNQG
jgi:hypothetical protein